jgi:ribosomal RNA-processing protein 8
MSEWPLKPINTMINFLNKKNKKLIVGDFGCGTAEIAASVQQKVYSFDFVAVNDSVQACDIAHVCVLTFLIFRFLWKMKHWTLQFFL